MSTTVVDEHVPATGGPVGRLGGRIVDVVDDVRTVPEGVGWDRFAVWGGSGGAPHALAIAAAVYDWLADPSR